MNSTAVGRPAKSNQRLSKQIILKAALLIVQEQGTDALSFRVLADTLQVTPMAVTYHSGSKWKLMADLVELAFHNTLQGVTDDTPSARARCILTAYFKRAMLNANLLRAVLKDESLMSDELLLVTDELRVCTQELDKGDRGNVLMHLLIDYTHGFVLSATSGGNNTLTEDDYLRGVDWILTRTASEEGEQTFD
jgi:AcrR family transcriptional regulator